LNGICAQELSFTGLENYSRVYKTYGHNGLTGDAFIQTELQAYFPQGNDIDVLDIGAGDGRNSIPIARKGYNVFSIEKESDGRKLIEQAGKKYNLKIGIFDFDITTKIPIVFKQVNFAFMSLVTQHFTVDKFIVAMDNISKMIKSDGVLVFNALVRNKGHENLALLEDSGYGGDYFQEDSARDGTCHFKKQDILDITSKDFRLTKIADYNEQGSSRPHYMNWRWGMEKGKSYNRPVTLKWFVFVKNIVR
jgi:SAM-dependent methyltransferase